MKGAGTSPGRLISAAPGVPRGFTGGGEVGGGSAGVAGVEFGGTAAAGEVVEEGTAGVAVVVTDEVVIALLPAGVAAAGFGEVAVTEVAVVVELGEVAVVEPGEVAETDPGADTDGEGAEAVAGTTGFGTDELGGFVTVPTVVGVGAAALTGLSAATLGEAATITAAASPIHTGRPCAMTVLRPARPM